MQVDAMQLQALIAAVLDAPDDDARASAGAALFTEPDALARIAAMLPSADWTQRGLALHFVTRLSPPPALFASGVIHCLRNPLDPDPHGDELALVLVCCGALAHEVAGFRDVIAQRVRAIERTKGPHGPVMRRLAHETLAKIDAARAESARAWDTGIASVVALLQLGRHAEAELWVTQSSADTMYPELGRAARWESAGDKLRATPELARFCYERALRGFEEHASGASSGGEGMARMLDVDRLRDRLRHL
jgi:hypothetical protein